MIHVLYHLSLRLTRSIFNIAMVSSPSLLSILSNLCWLLNIGKMLRVVSLGKAALGSGTNWMS